MNKTCGKIITLGLLLGLSVASAISTASASTTTGTFDFPFRFPFFPGPPSAVSVPLEVLPELDLDPTRVTVSGVSSGGFMAVQLHVALSSVFTGAASLAGGTWECAKGDVGRSQSVCMNAPQNVVTKDHVDLAYARANRGEIDDLANLRDDRVAIFASTRDMVIKPAGSDKLEEFYQQFMPKTSISRITSTTAAHGFPTLAYGNSCGMMGSPWILNCGDDVAGKLLAAVESTNRTMAARTAQDSTNYVYFDQSKIVSSTARMYAWGAAYIPKACRLSGAKCGLHVALHGCQMNPDFIQKKFVENAGYNEWAESNQLVVLYPQSAKGLGNPYGCWDWFGFTGSVYTSKSAVQIEAVRSIMNAIGLK